MHAQIFSYQQFNSAQLIDHSKIYDFCQDRNLIYYFGTEEGLIYYNGESFFPIREIGDLEINGKVKAITALENQILFTYNASLYKYNSIDSSINRLLEKIEIIKLQTVNKDVYLSTSNALFKLLDFNQGTIDTVFHDVTTEINDWIINKNNIIIATTDGLVTIEKQAMKINRNWSFLNAISLNRNSDTTLLVLGKQKAGSAELYKFNEKDISKEIDLKLKNPVDIYFSYLGNTWIADESGEIILYNGFSFIDFKNDNPIDDFPILKFKEDLEGNLWVLGIGSILRVKVNSAFKGRKFPGILSVESNQGDIMYLSKHQIQITNPVFKDRNFRIPNSMKIKDTPAPFYHQGEWFINGNSGLLKLDKNTLIPVDSDERINLITKIGNKLFGLGPEGIFSVHDNFTMNEIIIERNKISQQKISPNGNKIYFLNNSSELTVISEDILKTFKLTDQFVKDFKKLSFFNGILGNHQASQVQLLKGNNELEIIDLAKELDIPNINIYNLFLDSKENLWISTNTEIIRISFTNANQTSSIQNVDFYSINDNLYSSYFKEVVEVEDGSLYFLNNNFITIFNPLLENPNLVNPGIILKRANAISFDRFNNPQDTINLQSINKKPLAYGSIIQIEASVITSINKSKSKINYRIKDINQDWITVNNDNLITIFDIPVGEHIIELKAVSSDDIESAETISIQVQVERPFWKEYWFYLLIIVLLLIIGFLIYRSIINFQDNTTKELHEKLDKELDDLEKRTHLQILKAERLKQLNELITSQKSELEKKNKQIESQKYELSLTNGQIKKQKDLLEETSSKLKASINYAQRIQNALMSTEIEIKEAIDTSFVYFQPRDVVSGDFYWFNKKTDPNGDELYILAAVDCTGHGVPGAIVSVVGMNLLNNITNLKGITDPGEILFELNEDIITNLRQNETQVNDGMDMSIVTINPKTKQVKFAGAKNPLMYVENGELIRIRGDKFAIGGQQREKDRNYVTHTIDPSDQPRMYYLFSDGYQDQFGGEKGFKFLTSNFKNLLLEIHNKPVLDQKEILYQRINEWKGDYHQTDDMLVIGFRF